MSKPAVSVIIPAYNREHVIGEAIRSILGQTMADFELIIVDDGSTDRTAMVVQSFTDRRIRLLSYEQNRGIPSARNSGLDAARGTYIAWLDSDDVARPRRLETQLRFLHDNSATAMVGACAGKIDEQGRSLAQVRRPPFSHEQIRAWLLFRSAFQQSSIFGRAAILKRFPYRPEYPVCEDIDVFVRLSREHRLQNLPRVLVDRRIHNAQSGQIQTIRVREAKKSIQSTLLASIGVLGSPDDLERHITLGSGSSAHVGLDADLLNWAEQWLEKLIQANEVAGAYHPGALRFACSYFWTAACRHIEWPKRGGQSFGRYRSLSGTTGWFTAAAAKWLAQAALVAS